MRSLDEWLRAGAQTPAASPLWNLFVDALSRQDLAEWHRLREELKDLHEMAPQARWLRELYGRLSGCAPVWTSRILGDPTAAGDPADFDAAWQWRQLDSWVREAFAGPTPAQLQAQLEELSRARRRIIADLVSERAWRRLADNLGDRERQALNSYVRAVTRYGKTGRKSAQRWLMEIRSALNESKNAIPVWIMPTVRALTSFRPEAAPPFDVLVVDEASAIGLEAVPLLALARKTIVLGDDKQTGPENVGLNRQKVFDLLDEHLAGIPKYRTLFDPDNSLYDIAFQKFPGVVMLTEHFRLPQLPRPARPAAPSGNQAGPALLPYQAWTPRVLPHPDTAPLPAVIAGLREIVAAEGPIRAQRAYRVYTLAAGGRRVGPEMRRAFHAATREALRAGDIRQLDDGIVPLDEKTLCAPGKPTVLVRELGPRQLSDVPRTEVAKLVRYLGLERAADDVIKRAVLSAYRLVRLTVRTSQYLDECLSHLSDRSATS
jgi:hypothetical protein